MLMGNPFATPYYVPSNSRLQKYTDSVADSNIREDDDGTHLIKNSHANRSCTVNAHLGKLISLEIFAILYPWFYTSVSFSCIKREYKGLS